MKKFNIINVSDTDNMLDGLLEYKMSKKFKGTLQEFIDSLQLSTHIYVDEKQNVVPYSIDDDVFVCAADDPSLIQSAIDYASRDLSKLKCLTKEDEFTGKYFNRERLVINGQSYTEEVGE